MKMQHMHSRFAFGVFGLFVLPALAACTVTSTPAPASGTSPSDPSTGAATADGACTTLTAVAREVTLRTVAGAAPPPAGGALHDGTYVLTDAALYVGPGGTSGPTPTLLEMTVRITGDVVERASNDASNAGPTRGTVTAAGTRMTSVDSCPDDTTNEVGFTSTETTLTAFISTTGPDGSPATLVETFTQP